MSRIVLDASAILALLASERGGEEVSACLPDAAMSAVNLSEVGTKLADRGMREREIRSAIGALGLEVATFDAEAAYAAAMLRDRTRQIGLSLGDRACLALGAARGVPVLTADRDWAGLTLGIEIRLIR